VVRTRLELGTHAADVVKTATATAAARALPQELQRLHGASRAELWHWGHTRAARLGTWIASHLRYHVLHDWVVTHWHELKVGAQSLLVR